MKKNKIPFIAEVSSNHAGDLDRCKLFIKKSAEIGCQAVKFQLFKIDELFSPEILASSQEHQDRREWELPLSFIPELAKYCDQQNIAFSCTPFYLDAVKELEPYVAFYKIASYELLWDDLIIACAQTGKPLYMSTGMATIDEIKHAVDTFQKAGGVNLTLFHCVSGYPVPEQDCNLAAIKTLAQETGCAIGWSDHSRNPDVIRRAIDHWGAKAVEFHIDLDETGAEYKTGHCWLPHEIAPVIKGEGSQSLKADGNGIKKPTAAEIDDRLWRADPSDGLRPFKEIRKQWLNK